MTADPTLDPTQRSAPLRARPLLGWGQPQRGFGSLTARALPFHECDCTLGPRAAQGLGGYVAIRFWVLGLLGPLPIWFSGLRSAGVAAGSCCRCGMVLAQAAVERPRLCVESEPGGTCRQHALERGASPCCSECC